MQTPEDARIEFSVKELFLEIRNDIRNLTAHVNDLEKRGSDNAREALKELNILEARIQKLEMTSATSEAVSKNERTLKTLALGVFISVAGMILNFVAVFFTKK
jgi:hypothetical protein